MLMLLNADEWQVDDPLNYSTHLTFLTTTDQFLYVSRRYVYLQKGLFDKLSWFFLDVYGIFISAKLYCQKCQKTLFTLWKGY